MTHDPLRGDVSEPLLIVLDDDLPTRAALRHMLGDLPDDAQVVFMRLGESLPHALTAGERCAAQLCTVVDAVKQIDGAGRVVDAVDREMLRTAGTPVICRAGVVRAVAERPEPAPIPSLAEVFAEAGLVTNRVHR